MWRNCLAYLAWHRQKNWTLGSFLREKKSIYIYISVYIYILWIIILIIMIIVVYIIYTYASASFFQHGKYLQFWSDLHQNTESRHLLRFLEHPKETMLRWFFPSQNHCEEDLSVYVYHKSRKIACPNQNYQHLDYLSIKATGSRYTQLFRKTPHP